MGSKNSENVKGIYQDQRGFIELCVPVGFGILMLMVAWTGWVLQAFAVPDTVPSSLFIAFGILVNLLIVYAIGAFIARKQKKKYRRLYKLFAISGFVIACAILYLLSFTKLGC